jgi:fatty-acyl-CoA synthase
MMRSAGPVRERVLDAVIDPARRNRADARSIPVRPDMKNMVCAALRAIDSSADERIVATTGAPARGASWTAQPPTAPAPPCTSNGANRRPDQDVDREGGDAGDAEASALFPARSRTVLSFARRSAVHGVRPNTPHGCCDVDRNGGYTAIAVTSAYRDVTVGDLLTRLAEALPNNDALLCAGGPRYTFAALEHEARVIARGLMAIGVERGERLVIWATNVPEWVVLQFAVAKIGAILVAAHTASRARDIDYLLTQSGAGTIVTISGFRGQDYVATLRDVGAHSGHIPTLKRLIHLSDEAPDEFVPYTRLRDLANQIDESLLDDRAAKISVDEPVNIQFTSGTTGLPKGVMLSSRGLVNNAAAVGQVLGLTPVDRLCLCVPMFHAFGYAVGVLGCYTHGACVCLVDHFDPRRVLQTVERERCTVLHGVPTMFLSELECRDFDRYDLSSLRTGVMAGAPCPAPVMRRVMTDMHLTEMTIAYGLTEASPAITMTPRHASVSERTETVGVALPEMEISVVDPITRLDLKSGERGELRVRGYNVMLGYYNELDATRSVLDPEGWLYTGDEAIMDHHGVYRITGRTKDVIISGGENIAPAEIENCLREHPDVADASAYGLSDPLLGERVGAAIRIQAGKDTKHVTGDALIAWCRKRLAPFKVPTAIRFVTDFPMTPSGKVQKFKLRDDHRQAVSLISG